MKLVIGNKNYSSWSLRPWLLLTHHGVEFDEVPVSLNHPHLTQHLKQFSASAKVPVLIDGKITVWDSLAICEYLSEHHLNHQGWPEDPAWRAYARAISAEMHSGFGALRNQLPMNLRAKRHVVIDTQAQRDIDRIDEIFNECQQRYGSLGPWLMGSFSIADCMFAPVVTRFVTYGIGLSAPGQAYVERVMSSPTLKRWIQQALLETEIVAADEKGSTVND